MSVVLLLLINSAPSYSDSQTSQFKPHPNSGKYSAIACRSTGNNAPIQFSGNAATAARTFLSPSEIIGGNLRSNADIKISGNGFVNGDATPAPGHSVNKTGNATVTGSIQPATNLLDCSIGNLTQLISWVQQNNNDSSIPPTNQGRMPWGCGNNPPPNDPWQFCLKGNETIHLSGGTYWFSSWSQSGNSKIIVDGYVRILVTGSIGLSGNISINADGNPYNLLIFAIPDNSFSLQMSGNTIFNGLIYGPSITAQLSGQSTLNGNLISQELSASGQAKLKQWIDETVPEINFTAPTATCLNSQNITASLTITDNESGIDPENIYLYLDGNPIAISANPADSSWHSVNVQAALTGLSEGYHQIISSVWDRAGNYSEKAYNLIIDLTLPIVHITMPADGSSLQSNQVLVEGIASDNYQDSCGLSLAVNGNPIGIEPDGQWLTTISFEEGETSKVIEAVAQDGAGNISREQITISSFMAPLLQNYFPFSLDANPNSNRVAEIGYNYLEKWVPTWANIGHDPVNTTSHISAFQGPDMLNLVYQIADDHGSYSSSSQSFMSSDPDFYLTRIYYPPTISGSLPHHKDATFVETLDGLSTSFTWTMHIGHSFFDVPTNNPFYREIETLWHYGISGTCICHDPGEQNCFCPDDPVTRASAAIMIARTLAMGDGNVPSSGPFPMLNDDPASGTISSYSCVLNGKSYFSDIAPESFPCKYVHYLYAAGIIEAAKCAPACADNNLCFCPNSNITRAELAKIVALAISRGDISLRASYTDPTIQDLPPNNNLDGNILRHYSCDADANPLRTHFDDVPATHPLCRHIHYLWARNIVEACRIDQQKYYFYRSTIPDDALNNVTRGLLAGYLVKAFRLDLYKANIKREFLCPYSGNLSWGDYDLLMTPGLSDAGIDRVINLSSAAGIGRGLRTMINIVFADHHAGDKLTVQPYKARKINGEYFFDLTQDNPVFWNRVDRLVNSMKVAGSKKKPVFTISNQWGCTTQGGQYWVSPWCHNVNDIYYDDDWMGRWKTMTWQEQHWIISEYIRLAQLFLQNGVDTIELYNEANLHKKDGSLDLDTIQAHKDIISALKAIPNLKIQVNFSPSKPSCTDTDMEKCENEIIYPNKTQGSTRIGFEDSDFSKIWNDFTKDSSDWKVDYFSVHSIKPSHLYWLTPELLNRTNRNNEMILELSTDGQHACSPATGRSHHLEAEIIKKLMDYTAAYPGLNFEYDFDLESIQSVEKIKNVCYRDDSKVMVDIKANCRDDGPVCIEPNDPLDNTICHNVIVWTSINADNCIITPKESANSHWNDGPRGAGWENLKTTNPNNDDRTYRLDCWKGPLNNQALHYYDYVRVYCKAKCP